ncbi:lung adenoma susceptibility protein 2 isoform X2 [Tyto alba]|uniref:lung adenoma susceptibility protein 2 isoform X2 n=1 Tax=Tyto alba TaxID=56313 RepID=UPI001C68515C|nr:lung adenoma susceptibility protein 2 isoform X2 [Tyto alba]
MTSSIEESSVCSPDSTVSSLLTSYSIDSSKPYSNSLIHYKDKLYSSASEALEAYIEDFNLSLTSSEISTGKICICQSTPKQVKFSKNHTKGKHEEQLELLTLKADRGLEGSTEDLSSNLENDVTPSTIDILGAERSWENAPGALKPPVPVCCEDVENALPFPKADIIHKFLEDCLNDKNKDAAFSGGHHHRPLEALKLMLFKLQAIRGSLSRNETAEQKEELEKLSKKAEAELKLCDSERIPLTNSIRKALHHLSRLKSLVEDNSNQQEQTDDQEEDKQQKK